MDAKGRVACRRVVDRAPAVRAPMHNGGSQQLDTKDSARRHRANLVVEAPGDACATLSVRPGNVELFAAADRRSRRSRSDRHNLTYSACAHTSGMAEPDACPMKSSRSGMSALSQICSGRRPLSPARVSIACARRSRRVGCVQRRARSGRARRSAAARRGRCRCRRTARRRRARRSRRPDSDARRARAAYPTLSVASMTLTVFTMRGSSAARSPKRTNASASRLTIKAAGPVAVRRPVLDRNESLTRRRGIGPIRLGDPDVIPVDLVLSRQFGVRDIQPSSMLAFHASAVSRR